MGRLHLLRELHICNLAIIADIRIEFQAGLNCFTGQTGAGKSLIIGALELLLALRSPRHMLRAGATEGRITGVFQVQAAALRRQLAAQTDLPLQDEPELILVRRLHESGRTGASLNGHPITGTMLQTIAEMLVDIHGQHDAQFLLQPANQLSVLDDFAGAADLAEDFRRRHQQRQSLLRRREEGRASEMLRRSQLELGAFQAAEIDRAAFQPQEQQQLELRHRLLSNMEKLQRLLGSAYAALYEEEGAVVGRLKAVTSALLEAAELNPDVAPVAAQTRDATVSLDDAAFTLRRVLERLELDPRELTEVTERLNLLNRLIHKYCGAGGTLEQLLEFRRHVGEELARLRSAEQNSAELESQITQAADHLAKIGAVLSDQRRAAARKLIPLVREQLADLGMKDAQFHVDFRPLAAPIAPSDGAEPGEATRPRRADAVHAGRETGNQKPETTNQVAAGAARDPFPSPSGLETVEFMLAANPGQPPRPLRQIASGGELSRTMLALKTILAQADRSSVLVFDEIDANVGGRMGGVIGEKLRALAARHQVLCITHLPQIAAFADRHLSIRKRVENNASFTEVCILNGEGRTRELAAMTVGKNITQVALAQASELLQRAARRPSPGAGGARERRDSPG